MSETAPSLHSQADNDERFINDLPWITRAVNSQVTIPLEMFFNTLLPEYTLVSIEQDAHIEDIIREHDDSDMKKSFTCLFNTFGSCERRGVDGELLGDSTYVAHLRVPDCALMEIDLEGKNTGLNKEYYTTEGRYESVWHLLAKKASDAMSTGIPRNHIYGVYVKKEYAQFLYYDHSAVIVSEPMNWTEDAHTFWKVIYTISKLGLDRIGCAAQFVTFPDLGLHINRLDFEFIDVVHASEHIIGECTSMIHARVRSDGPLRDQVVTIKFNFIPKDKGWRYENDVVSDLREKLPKLARLGLPNIITSKVFESSAIEGEVRKLLGDQYQSRELQVTVYAGQLYPVTTLVNELDILTVFHDVMRVLHGMCKKQSLSHRSLNPSNILCHRTGDKMRGVLIGYELCAHSDDVENGTAPSCLSAMESLPFLSPDTLNETELCVLEALDCHRRDLEAMYYVLFFITMHYDNGKRIAALKPPFNIWFGDDQALSGSSKEIHVLTENPHFDSTPSFAMLGKRLEELQVRIRCGYIMRDELDLLFLGTDIVLWVNCRMFCQYLFDGNH